MSILSTTRRSRQSSRRTTERRQLQKSAYDAAYMNGLQAAYQTWAATSAVAPLNPPQWSDFVKSPLWRVPHTAAPWIGFWDKMLPPLGQGNAFDTTSGKIEFYSDFLADPNMAQKSFFFPQRKTDAQICFGGSIPPQITPLANFLPAPTSMLGPNVTKYPLMMITTHSQYRQHVSQDNNSWLRDEGRHACWISVADANSRGISDGDTVHVFNDKGELYMTAYVTERIMPGVVVVRHGAWTSQRVSRPHSSRKVWINVVPAIS